MVTHRTQLVQSLSLNATFFKIQLRSLHDPFNYLRVCGSLALIVDCQRELWMTLNDNELGNQFKVILEDILTTMVLDMLMRL